ncbi:MAG: hypothetical protein IJ813_01700 [Bacteroidales bacterium]|nr:hypothetical protein [Bacteroidales bacterium]
MKLRPGKEDFKLRAREKIQGKHKLMRICLQAVFESFAVSFEDFAVSKDFVADTTNSYL